LTWFRPKHEIVLGKVAGARLQHRRPESLDDQTATFLGLALECFVLDELVRQIGQHRPGPAEILRQSEGDDPVVEQLEADTEPVDHRCVDGCAVEPQGRLEILHVGGSGRLGRQPRGHAAANQRRRRLQVDRLGDIEEVEREDLSLERFHGSGLYL
jgi:hypothetical protein